MTISPNNQTLKNLKKRRLKIEDLIKKSKDHRREGGEWARRVFVFFRKDEIPTLVRPIVEGILETVVSFGHGRHSRSFKSLTQQPEDDDSGSIGMSEDSTTLPCESKRGEINHYDLARRIVRDHVLFPALTRIFLPLMRRNVRNKKSLATEESKAILPFGHEPHPVIVDTSLPSKWTYRFSSFKKWRSTIGLLPCQELSYVEKISDDSDTSSQASDEVAEEGDARIVLVSALKLKRMSLDGPKRLNEYLKRVKDLQSDLMRVPTTKDLEEKYEKICMVQKIVRNHVLFPALTRIFRPLLRNGNNNEIEESVNEENSTLYSDSFEALEESLDEKMERYFSSMSQNDQSTAPVKVVTEEVAVQTEDILQTKETVGTQTTPTIVQPNQLQQSQTQQKVQIVRSSGGKIQVLGLLPGQRLVQMPDGKLQIFSQPPVQAPIPQPVQTPPSTAVQQTSRIVVKETVSCQTDEEIKNSPDCSMETMVKFLMKQEDPLSYAKLITKHGGITDAEQILELLKTCLDETQVKEVLTLLKEEMLPRFPILQDKLTRACLRKFQQRPVQYTHLVLQLCNQMKHAEKLLEIIDVKKEVDFKDLIGRLIEENLPQFPKEAAVQQKLALYCLKKFKDNPKDYATFVVKLCSSEESLGRLLQIVEEKTAFDNQWCVGDLKDIMVQISDRCFPLSQLKIRFMRIVLDQFAVDPAQWAYHLFNYGSEKDVVRSLSLLEEFMTIHHPQESHQNLFICMKQLVSRVKKKWPAAENDFFSRIFPTFIQRSQLQAEEYVKLFCGYIGLWRENEGYFRMAISSLWKRMKSSNLSHWGPLINEFFVKLAHEKNFNSILKELCESMAAFIQTQIGVEESNGGKLALPQASSLKLPKCLISSDRCEGCSQLEMFLKNEQQERMCITVNEMKRRCVRRQLDSAKIGQQPLSHFLQTEECDVTKIRERYSRWVRGNCGGIGVTKKRMVSHLVPM